MKIWEDRHGDIVILGLHGRLDATSSAIFEQSVQPMLDRGDKRFILDLMHLEYISSAGLRRLLILGKKTSESGGRVVLQSVSGHVLEILELSGFTQIFPIFSTQEEAVRSF